MNRRNESIANADLESEVGLNDHYSQQNSNGNVMKIVAQQESQDGNVLLETLPGEIDEKRGFKTGQVKTGLTSFRKSGKPSNKNMSRASERSYEPSTVKIQSRQPEDQVM